MQKITILKISDEFGATPFITDDIIDDSEFNNDESKFGERPFNNVESRFVMRRRSIPIVPGLLTNEIDAWLIVELKTDDFGVEANAFNVESAESQPEKTVATDKFLFFGKPQSVASAKPEVNKPAKFLQSFVGIDVTRPLKIILLNII